MLRTEKKVTVKGKRSKIANKETREFYLFISPWLIGFLLFTGGPIIYSLFLGFCQWDLLTPIKFAGLGNYQKIFTDDPLFWQSAKVTSMYVASVPLRLIAGLLIALIMNQKIRGIAWFRTIYYLPAVISGVALALLWMWLFSPRLGLINRFLGMIGIVGPEWLFSETWALPALIIMSLWSTGSIAIIFLAGLQGIPTSLYEAAEIDGASFWHKFLKITLPLLTPVILFNLIIGIIGSFQVFTEGYVMTGGGPNHATLFYVLYIFRNAFELFKMGYAATLSMILFFAILICTLVIWKSTSFWVYYEAKSERR